LQDIVCVGIDNELPELPAHDHTMLDFAASWVEIPEDGEDQYFERYPDESLAAKHKRMGLTQD